MMMVMMMVMMMMMIVVVVVVVVVAVVVVVVAHGTTIVHYDGGGGVNYDTSTRLSKNALMGHASGNNGGMRKMSIWQLFHKMAPLWEEPTVVQ